MRSCPKCKTTDFNNRNFTLMINECGHSLCNNCVDTLFARNTGPCPTCAKPLRLKGFWLQTLDDPQVEKEVHFRKKLGRTFNLLQDDFASLKEYNDYLELIETAVYNLVQDQHLEETARKIQAFQKEHEQQINRNKGRRSCDEIFIQQCIDQENANKNKYAQREECVEKKEKQQAAKELIHALRDSHMPAEVILNSKRRDIKDQQIEGKQKKERQAKVALEMKQETIMQAVHEKVGTPFHFDQLALHLNGPELPDVDAVQTLGHLNHMRTATNSQLAGGYHHMFACYRALTDASSDLYLM